MNFHSFTDLNDNVPVFDRTSYTAIVNENATVSKKAFSSNLQKLYIYRNKYKMNGYLEDGNKKILAAVGFEPTPPKRLVP